MYLGPEMPRACSSHAVVKTPNSEGIIVLGCGEGGGVSDSSDLFKLEWKDETTLEWSTMTQKLKYPRFENAAMYVPNHMVNCHTGRTYL